MSNWLVKEWRDKARKDRVSLELLLQTKKPDTAEAICFLAQQSVEKLMKGLLTQQKVAPPKTRNLIELQFILEPHYPARLSGVDLEELSIWAVESRYLGVVPTWDQAVSAAECCKRLTEALLPMYEEDAHGE